MQWLLTEEAWHSRDSEGVKMTLLRIYTLKECREKGCGSREGQSQESF